jgi:LysR family nitrogen assimilation transcriptional regulator
VEIRQLKYFLAIANQGSLSKAAAQLFVAQSALSQQTAQLEKEMGVRLFYRSPTGVTLTEQGRVFYEHAQIILRQLTEARNAIGNSSSDPAGTVVLGIPQSISDVLALPLLLAARQRYPQVTLQLMEANTGDLSEQLRLGRLNLAILLDDPRSYGFVRVRFLHEQLRLIDAGGAAVLDEHVDFAAALKKPLLLPGAPDGVRYLIDRTAGEHGLAIENLVAEISSTIILKNAILAGVGSTLLPLAPFRAEIEQGLMQARPIRNPPLSCTHVLCASRNAPVTSSTRAVKRLVVDVAHELCEKQIWPDTQTIAGDDADMFA